MVWLFGTSRPLPEWYDEYLCERLPPVVVLVHLTGFFTAAGALKAPYSNHQVPHGLDYLVQTGISDALLVLQDEAVPARGPDACVLSIYHLFEQVFAPGSADPALGWRADRGRLALRHLLHVVGQLPGRAPARVAGHGAHVGTGVAGLPGERAPRIGPLAASAAGSH
jgi:hypothetical protein